jgi:hypothetical protein
MIPVYYPAGTTVYVLETIRTRVFVWTHFHLELLIFGGNVVSFSIFEREEAQKLELQLKKEWVSKLKDFKQAMFGEYVCNVNTLKRDRFFDIPIPASKATPYNPKLTTLGRSLAMH